MEVLSFPWCDISEDATSQHLWWLISVYVAGLWRKPYDERNIAVGVSV